MPIRRAPARHAVLLTAYALALAGPLGPGACRGVTDPPLPAAAERFTPPPVYARWWALTEACSGISRPLSAVQFYRVPGAASLADGPDGSSTAGYWSPVSNRIVLAGRYAEDGRTVRHEMLHTLVRGSGHSPEYFQGRCAGVVDCQDIGCRDAGPPPVPAPAEAPTLPLSSLDLRVEALPNLVSRTAADRALSLVVRVTNPRPGPVWVPLEPSPDLQAPWVRGFGFRLVPTGQRVPVADLARSDSAGFVTGTSMSRVPFAAGQTRMWVIDLSGSWYPAGDYLAVGIFNARQVWAPLTVAP